MLAAVSSYTDQSLGLTLKNGLSVVPNLAAFLMFFRLALFRRSAVRRGSINVLSICCSVLASPRVKLER